MSVKDNRNTSRDDKHYLKLLRTYKLVVYMVLAALFVIAVSLLFIWIYDKLGGSFMSRGWQIFFMIVFSLLAAGLQLPEYIIDIRKIEMGNPTTAAVKKHKSYDAVLEHAKKEGIIDEDNQLQFPRTDFVRFCVRNNYFYPHRKDNWRAIDGVLKDSDGQSVSADKLTQSFQDIQAREGLQSK